MRLTTAIAVVVVASVGGAAAFAPLTPSFSRAVSNFAGAPTTTPTALFLAESTRQDESSLSDDESTMVNVLWNQSGKDDAVLQQLVLQALPSMSPKLIMKLKQQASNNQKDNYDESVIRVANALQAVLDERLASGREVLETLLEAGELRKLDAEIGKACRAGKLDMGFFTVLDMNLKDAATMEEEGAEEEGEANRLSILKHVYTRCQEEVEKLIPAGVALLNKLLRTQQDPIRANQLQHYLLPQPNVITLPDGQEIPVPDGDQDKILVPHSEFVDALGSTVQQIRTVEQAGGMGREAAANMVEAVRTVAKEARYVIGENFGVESDELRKFEDGLQPVFRPDSPESPYIKGEEDPEN